MTEREESAAPASKDESRREALKRFARYAAVAPTTMLLLSPSSGHAHHRPWHNPPGPFTNPGGSGDDDY
jgi:hypothetical protein